jgi:hypothetical protein
VVNINDQDDVAYRLDCAAALGLTELCHILLEGDDQILGVHICPNAVVAGFIISLWHHLYVNGGLTEPTKMPWGKLLGIFKD